MRQKRKPNNLVVDLWKKYNYLQLRPRPPIFSSFGKGWDGIHFEYHHQPPWECPISQYKQHTIFILLGHYPVEIESWVDRSFESGSFKNGHSHIVSAQVEQRSNSFAEAEYILLSIEPTFLASSAYESTNAHQIEIGSFRHLNDPLIYQIGLTLKSSLEIDGNCDLFYVESLANLFSVHLLKQYNLRQLKFRQYTDGLSKHQLRQAIDYINDCLDGKIKLADLAALLNMSPYYFATLFKQSTGIAPHQYLVRCRLNKAKRLLIDTNLALNEIAKQCGFSSQSHLNSLFRRFIGTTPKVYRQNLQ
jgi:AraC family transcriptional regulator